MMKTFLGILLLLALMAALLWIRQQLRASLSGKKKPTLRGGEDG